MQWSSTKPHSTKGPKQSLIDGICLLSLPHPILLAPDALPGAPALQKIVLVIFFFLKFSLPPSPFSLSLFLSLPRYRFTKRCLAVLMICLSLRLSISLCNYWHYMLPFLSSDYACFSCLLPIFLLGVFLMICRCFYVFWCSFSISSMCYKYLLPVCRLSSLSLKCLLMDRSFHINIAKCIDLFLCLTFFVSS